MGLIECPECGREISDRAKKCPGCGYPIKKRIKVSFKSGKKKTSVFKNKLFVFCVVFVLTISVGIGTFLKLWKPAYIYRSTVVSTDPEVAISTKGLSADGKHLSYINKNIKVTGGDVDYFKEYSDEDDELGVEKIKIENNGGKEIEALEVSVYFLNNESDVIHSYSFNAIGWGDSSLKPHQKWEMEKGMFHQLENVPRNIDVSKYAIAVTNIKFKGEKKYSW